MGYSEMSIGKIIGKLIPAKVVQQIVHAKAEELGEDFSAFVAATTPPNEPSFLGRVWCWILRNKALVSTSFLGAAGWAWIQGCPPVYGIQILPAWLSCDAMQKVMLAVGCFLLGSGVLDKDSFARLKQIAQGKIADPRVARTGTTGQFPAIVMPMGGPPTITPAAKDAAPAVEAKR
jgi:hypothetical protein